MPTPPDPARRSQLREQVASLKWFHAIDFGDFQSAGRFPPDKKPNNTLFGAMDLLAHLDLSEATCLDVGAAHGLMSFGLKTKGARRVVAVDNSARPGIAFSLARELLALDVEYAYSPASELVKNFGPRSVDFVLAAGLMYHLANPGNALYQTRRILKPGGLLILETAYASWRNDHVLVFNAVPDAPYNEPYTYFLPSRLLLEELLRLACFDLIAVRSGGLNRLTVLARAVAPDQVQGRCDMTVRAHTIGTQDIELPFTDYRSDANWTALARYDGKAEPFKAIDPVTYTPNFPPHPSAMTNPLGDSVFNKAPAGR